MVSIRCQPAASVGPGETHAWLVNLDEKAATRADEVLDDRERARAASYLVRLEGARYAAGRVALRRILAGYTGLAPRDLEFQIDLQGRPRLAGHDLRFSIARSAALALIAISAVAVGADLERIEPRPGLADLAAARFGAAEPACIASGCAGSPLRGFYRHWTAKEAYLKAVGCGLRGLGHADLECDGAATMRLRGQSAPGWEIAVLDMPAGYAGAIATGQLVTRCGG